MTKVGRENLLVAAIVFSVAAHIALMVGMRSQVMTHVDRKGLHSQHRETMRVSDYEEIEDPVRIERIKDIMSAKEAPAATPRTSQQGQAPTKAQGPQGREHRLPNAARNCLVSDPSQAPRVRSPLPRELPSRTLCP